MMINKVYEASMYARNCIIHNWTALNLGSYCKVQQLCLHNEVKLFLISMLLHFHENYGTVQMDLKKTSKPRAKTTTAQNCGKELFPEKYQQVWRS